MSDTHVEPSKEAFAALRIPGARVYLVGTMLIMLADSIEHVISYWVIFQKFHSPALAGTAVIAHWAPFLFLGVWAGSLADRFDPRRLIQIGMVLFMLASLGWGVLIATDTLEQWHAVVLLVVHGMANIFWFPAGQVLVHEIVGAAQLQSAIRLLATARTLGLLLGPAVGGGMMLAFGAANGLFINILIYLPITIWLWRAPYGPKFRDQPMPPRAAVSGLQDIIDTIRNVATNSTISSMILLGGAVSFFIGTAFQAQMPEFATDLIPGDRGVFYSVLLSANAAGALTAGLVLESKSLLPARPKTAFILVGLWCVVVVAFSVSNNFYVSVGLLFVAGFLFLAGQAMTQTLVQLHAPAEMRGRIIGLYTMSALGLMSFSGITVGFGGSLIGIHWSLGLSAILLFFVTAFIFVRVLRPALRTAAAE